MTDTVLIVGGGIAGLSAGCYLRMNGYPVRIFERHDLPGGLCTTWKRKAYRFDGCLHWLVGSGPAAYFHRYWRELGVLQERGVVNHEEFVRIEDGGGKALILYTDADRLESHLRELSPGDGGLIRSLTGAVRRLGGMLGLEPGPPRELAGRLDAVRGLAALAPHLPDLLRWSRITVHQFAGRFRDPFLRRHFAVPFDLPDFPMIGMIMTLAAMHRGAAGYTVGGSLELARAIERRFLSLGGEIRYRSPVAGIRVEGGRAVGVRLADGTEQLGGTVVSAADGRTTLFDLLEGRYLTAEWRRRYEEARIFPPLVQVSLGVGRDMSDQPHHVSFPIDPPLVFPGGRLDRLGPQHFGFDPTMAPPGRSAVVTYLPSRHAPWKALAADRTAYEAEKRRIADAVVAAYERRWPGFADQVEVVDVATPLTTERYTGNWQGSMEGWLITPETMAQMFRGEAPSKTLPGLDRFHMIGQWTTPGGGLPPAAQDGRNLARVLCARDGRRFTTTIP